MPRKPTGGRRPGPTTRFKWISNFTVTPQNVIALANEGGRQRWKIENEGFNVQKNGGYALEHPYSQNAVAGKVFYLLLQIAHLLFQLVERGSLFRKAFPAGVGSAKNLAFRLLEAWRNLRLSPEEIPQMLALRRQIRFDSFLTHVHRISVRVPLLNRVHPGAADQPPYLRLAAGCARIAPNIFCDNLPTPSGKGSPVSQFFRAGMEHS